MYGGAGNRRYGNGGQRRVADFMSQVKEQIVVKVGKATGIPRSEATETRVTVTELKDGVIKFDIRNWYTKQGNVDVWFASPTGISLPIEELPTLQKFLAAAEECPLTIKVL